MGAPKPENIILKTQEAPHYRPDENYSRISEVKPLPPEYGGRQQWGYKSEENIMEVPTEEQTLISEAAHLPGGLQTAQMPAPSLPPGFSKLNFPLPPWLTQLINTAAGIAAFTSNLGVSGAPDVLTCTGSASLKELMVCVESAVSEGKQLFQTAKEIAVLNTRVMSGGRPADAALVRLKTLISRPFARQMMKAMGTPMMCTLLMQREITPDRQRWLSGSVVTALTNLPVASDLTDSRSGGFGHVDVVLPRPSRIHRSDRIIEQLNKGTDPAETLYAALGIEGRTDRRSSS